MGSMRFSIRDLLWLTALVAVAIVWLMDRDRVRRDRLELAKREAELVSRAKMWEAEANRAEKRTAAINERLNGIEGALRWRDIKLDELIDQNNKPRFPRPVPKQSPGLRPGLTDYGPMGLRASESGSQSP